MDALYVHEPPSEENKCEEIFNSICDLDEKGLSYIFEAARNPTKLYDQMAQLLAHPLQRPVQRDVAYRLLNMADLEVVWQDNGMLDLGRQMLTRSHKGQVSLYNGAKHEDL